MTMFQSTPAKTPSEYIALLPEPRKTEVRWLHDFIRKAAPKLKPHIRAGMIGYGNYRCTYASGREVDWFVVGLASRKDGVSVYVCAGDGKQYLAEKYKKQLPKANVGKSCVRFKRIDDIDWDVFGKMIREAARSPLPNNGLNRGMSVRKPSTKQKKRKKSVH